MQKWSCLRLILINSFQTRRRRLSRNNLESLMKRKLDLSVLKRKARRSSTPPRMKKRLKKPKKWSREWTLKRRRSKRNRLRKGRRLWKNNWKLHRMNRQRLGKSKSEKQKRNKTSMMSLQRRWKNIRRASASGTLRSVKALARWVQKRNWMTKMLKTIQLKLTVPPRKKKKVKWWVQSLSPAATPLFIRNWMTTTLKKRKNWHLRQRKND